jgi:hypothetical protein
MRWGDWLDGEWISICFGSFLFRWNGGGKGLWWRKRDIVLQYEMESYEDDVVLNLN